MHNMLSCTHLAQRNLLNSQWLRAKQDQVGKKKEEKKKRCAFTQASRGTDLLSHTMVGVDQLAPSGKSCQYPLNRGWV